MTTTAAPAATPSTSAQPSAVARATPAQSAQPKKAPLLDADSIRADVQKLRLVKPEAKPAEEQLEDDLKQNQAEAQPNEPDATKTETPDEEAEKATPWAKKVKAELEQAKAKLAEFDGVKKHWAKQAEDARHERAEISDDRDHFKSLFEQAAAYLKSIGHEIDPLSLKHAETLREMARMKRLHDRGQGTAKEEQHAKRVADVRSKVDGIVAKFPELDPKRSKEAAEFLGMRLRSGDMTNFEADCRAWVQMQRGKKQLQRSTQSTPPPKPTERPESTTLGGTRSSGAAQTTKKPQLIDERSIKRALGIK
jgi:chromosome segregation ATPase